MQEDFDSYYKERDVCEIKWFEPFVEHKIIDEYNKGCITPGMNLLDVGSGCSMDSVFFASKGLNVTALDFAPKALDKLKNITNVLGVKIDVVCTSILDVPRDLEKKFDVISDNGCFHHIPHKDRSEYAKSVARLLKDNGILYIRAHSNFNIINSGNSKLRAKRLSSDDIISTFVTLFKFEEMSLFDYVLTSRGREKMWFIKLRLR